MTKGQASGRSFTATGRPYCSNEYCTMTRRRRNKLYRKVCLVIYPRASSTMKRQDERKRFLSGKWWKVNRKRYFNPVFLQGAGLPRRMPGGEVMDAYIEIPHDQARIPIRGNMRIWTLMMLSYRRNFLRAAVGRSGVSLRALAKLANNI